MIEMPGKDEVNSLGAAAVLDVQNLRIGDVILLGGRHVIVISMEGPGIGLKVATISERIWFKFRRMFSRR